jgi:hypothetical protein
VLISAKPRAAQAGWHIVAKRLEIRIAIIILRKSQSFWLAAGNELG